MTVVTALIAASAAVSTVAVAAPAPSAASADPVVISAEASKKLLDLFSKPMLLAQDQAPWEEWGETAPPFHEGG